MKMTQNALATPDRSSLRKMSPNRAISTQIQMMNMKNQNIDNSTWPDPNVLASIASPVVVGELTSDQRCASGRASR